jgi:hypothetical protein
MSTRARDIGVIAGAGGWWLLLTTAFLLGRGDDLGRLPGLLAAVAASMGRGPVWGRAGLVESLTGLAIAALIGLAWYGTGTTISRWLPTLPPEPRDDARIGVVAGVTLLGAAAWSIIWFFLGTAYLYRRPVAVATLLVGVALAVAALARERPGPGAIARVAGRATLVLVVTTQALALIAALAPPTAKDTLLYHFAIPRAYIAAGGGIEVPYNIAGYYPLGVELHAVWAMLLGAPMGQRAAEAAAGATLFLFSPLLMMVIFGWARERGLDRAWAAVAALMVVWVPTAYDVAASAYVDLALAAYTAVAVRAFCRWWTTLDTRHLVWVAGAIGGALSIKLSAAFVILPLALLALVRSLRCRSDSSRPTPGAAAVAVPAIVALGFGVTLAAPWYVRNWIRTGSPLFPFYLGLWPAAAPGWDLERSRLYETLFSLYGNTQSAPDYLLTPLRLAVAAQPDLPEFYDGVLGIAVVFALPVLAWALWTRRLDAELGLATLLSACLFAFWLFSSQQLRYLLPALPGLAVAIAAAGARLEGARERAFRALLVAAAVLGAPVALAWFLALDPARVVLGGEDRADFLRRRLDYYPYYEVVNRELPPTAKVWLINMRRDTYHLHRPYFSDFIFEDYTLTRYVRAATGVEDIRSRVRGEGITHLLVRHDILLDYGRSPIVDDRRGRQENEAKLALLRAFLLRGTRLIKGDQKFWLIELPPGPA